MCGRVWVEVWVILTAEDFDPWWMFSLRWPICLSHGLQWKVHSSKATWVRDVTGGKQQHRGCELLLLLFSEGTRSKRNICLFMLSFYRGTKWTCCMLISPSLRNLNSECFWFLDVQVGRSYFVYSNRGRLMVLLLLVNGAEWWILAWKEMFYPPPRTMAEARRWPLTTMVKFLATPIV